MLKFYNHLSHKKEVFKPLRKDWVGLYTCGPTVYNFAHIGNLRTYIFEDILRRTLEYSGYKVRHVMNITDVEDKIIRDAQKSGQTVFELVKPYEKAFFEDLKKLNIQKAWKYPKATKHILEMATIIKKLLKSGLAYKTGGSIYFDISKFKSYGKLSRVSSRELKAGARIDADEYAKTNAQDFVLWKAKKSGEPFWKTSLGEGRPGWHIECSAMSMKYLGPTFDLHAGAVDLIFPHHENEIAQSEGATNKKFSRYFVEGEHLLVNGEKMSKSLGNIYTLRDIEKKEYNPLTFRYLILTSHYRSRLNFTWKSLEAAQSALNNLYNELRNSISGTSDVPNINVNFRTSDVQKIEKRFLEAVNDDLNTPKAIAVVWEIIKNKNLSQKSKKQLLLKFDKVLGLGLKTIKTAVIPQKIIALAKQREEYRKNEQWDKADKIREKIQSLGYSVEDAPEGPRIRK